MFTKKWAQTIGLEVLSKSLLCANKSYHTTGSSDMTDYQYDICLSVLEERDPSNSLLKKVGELTSKKVKLPFPMMSLDKPKTGIEKWLARDFHVVMAKVDGISLMIDNRGPKTLLYKRGDGTIGQNITHLLPFLPVPKNMEKVCVRAEMIVPVDLFEQNYSEDFDNPRNFLGGITNRLVGNKKDFECVKIIAYQIYENYTKLDQLSLLKKMGFDVTWYCHGSDFDEQELTDLLISVDKDTDYEIDGLVIEKDGIHPIEQGNPSYAVAFKVNPESVCATVTGVEWNVSRKNAWKPVVLIKPVKLAGVTVSRATGFNYSFIKSNGIGKNAVIEVVRSGKVIPYITGVVKSVKPDFPPGQFYTVGVDAFTLEDNVLKKIEYFFTTIGVEGIGPGIIQKLIDAGQDSVEKICCACPEDFVCPGISLQGAKKLVANIKSALTSISLQKFMAASGCFHLLAEKKLSAVVEAYPDILKSNWNSSLYSRMLMLAGFGEKSAKSFVEGYPDFLKLVQNIKVSFSKKEVCGDLLAGQSICFTRVRDTCTENYIVANGGKVVSSVSKNTSLLIVKDLNTPSSKKECADKLGISVETLQQFKSKYSL